MRISHKIKYAVACLYELAKRPAEYIDASLIASSQQIPPAYAQKVLHHLAQAGLLFAQKGVGYRIARDLDSISVLDVMDAMSGEAEAAPVYPGGADSIERRVNELLKGLTLAQFNGRR